MELPQLMLENNTNFIIYDMLCMHDFNYALESHLLAAYEIKICMSSMKNCGINILILASTFVRVRRPLP